MNQKWLTGALIALSVVLAGALAYVIVFGNGFVFAGPSSGDPIQGSGTDTVPAGVPADAQRGDASRVDAPKEDVPGNAGSIASQETRDCFIKEQLADSAIRNGWKRFEGYGFSVGYPAEKIAIRQVGDPRSGAKPGFEISSLTGQFRATISVFRLEKEIYGASFLDASGIRYEPYSDEWWYGESVWDPSKFQRCSANTVGRTDKGDHPLFSTEFGDVGAFKRKYIAVLRDVPRDDNYEPLIVQFEAGGDMNDAAFAAGYAGFREILENMIRTLEVASTSKG